jgi:hypothetical protein
MMDVINPWGALRRIRKEFEDAQAAHWVEYKKWKTLNDKLKAQIAKGHFRNPKTGCIGPKGETFDV